jgi:hypothetical protein
MTTSDKGGLNLLPVIFLDKNRISTPGGGPKDRLSIDRHGTDRSSSRDRVGVTASIACLYLS